MIIDKINKVIFLETPKTGTSFIRHHLYDYKSDNFLINPPWTHRHAGIEICSRIYDLDPKDFDIHCFTRHPENWLISEFLEFTNNHLKPYLNGRGGERQRKYVSYRHDFWPGGDPFDLNTYLDTFLTDDEYKIPMKRQVELGSIWKPSVEYYEELDPNKIHIHKYEDFKNSIEKLFTAFKKPTPNPNEIIHKTNIKKPFPNRQNRSRINRIFDSDFKQFGYQKRTVMALNE